MPQASIVITADPQLQWVVRVPEILVGATRASSPAELARLSTLFAEAQTMFDEPARADAMAAAITQAVFEYLGEPPELPFIGEPFGGRDGTD